MTARPGAPGHRRAQGQSAMEQVLLIAAVAAALVGMQLYLRLAIQGRIHTTRASLLGREAPFYGDTTPTREYHFNITETVTSSPVHVMEARDPLRNLAENRLLTEFTAVSAFNETTVVR